jgi:hypothetical protein
MATYVNDLRLKEITTGDESGTWGTSTNTNLELIAEAFSYGTEVITTNADTHTTTIADGATDPGRSLYLKYTGTLDSACTITIGPNTVSKVWIIENGTSGSQDIILSQGSGANITIPAGDTKVVYSDGAGAGAAFFDAFASLSVVDLKVQDDLTVTGDIDVDGTTNLDVVDIDGAVDMASTALVTGVLTANGGAVFNEAGADVDFRVESDTVDHALFVQGSDGNVGIGTDSPDSVLHVSDTTQPKITIEDSTNNSFGRIAGGGSTGSLTFEADFDNTKAGTVIVFNVDNTERLRIDSSGNVGIGTSSPDTPLTVSVADDTIATRFKGTNGIFRILPFETGLGVKVTALNGDESAFETLALQAEDFHFVTGTTERLRIDSSGFVGIECTPDAWSGYSVLQIGTGGALSANEDITFLSANAYSSATGWKYVTTDEASLYQQIEGGHIWYGASSGSADAAISWAERMRIDSSGNLLVGTTSAADTDAGGKIFSSGIMVQGVPDTGLVDMHDFYRGTAGSLTRVGNIRTNGSSTSYNTSSDYRLKENITDANDAGDKIDAIKVRQYDWKADGSHQDYGMVAQELMTVAPEAVSGNADSEEMMGVDYSKLVPMLVKEIQSLRTRITALEG